jgi:hypothetical protein
VGDALLILVEIFAWGLILLLIGALLESGWARLRRRKRDTLID